MAYKKDLTEITFGLTRHSLGKIKKIHYLARFIRSSLIDREATAVETMLLYNIVRTIERSVAR